MWRGGWCGLQTPAGHTGLSELRGFERLTVRECSQGCIHLLKMLTHGSLPKSNSALPSMDFKVEPQIMSDRGNVVAQNRVPGMPLDVVFHVDGGGPPEHQASQVTDGEDPRSALSAIGVAFIIQPLQNIKSTALVRCDRIRRRHLAWYTGCLGETGLR